MITMPRRSGEGRTLAVALVLSLLVHLLGFLLYWQSSAVLKLVHLPAPHPSATPEFVTTSSSFRLEHRARPVPQPPHHRPAPPPQQPQPQTVAQQPQPPPVPKPIARRAAPTPRPVKAEIAKPVDRATPAPTPVPSPKTVVERPPSQVAARQSEAQPQRNAQRPDRLSAEQIAHLQQAFSKTIAQVRNETNPLRVPQATPAAPKRYKMQFEGHFGSLHNGEGEYWPIQHWSDQGNDCYYMAYDFVYESGGFEHGSVPWPVCFTPNSDPFMNEQLGKLHRTPLPPPPAGWKLTNRVQLGKALRSYFPGESFPDS